MKRADPAAGRRRVMTCPRCGGPAQRRRGGAPWLVVLALLGVALVLAWVLAGAFLHDFAEGLDHTRLPIWKVLVPLLVVAAATVVAARGRGVADCPRCDLETPVPPEAATRRAVLRGTAVAIAGTVGGVASAVAYNRRWIPIAEGIFGQRVDVMADTPRPEWRGSRIRRYRRLGRTEAKISDISVGCGRLRTADVARAAIDRGVTYFDTAPDYSDTASEQALGEAIQGHRDRLFLATKFCKATGHLENDTPVPEVIRTVEASLRRLRTDHVDLVHIHSCDRVERLMAENIHEGFDRLKEQGKVRFLGVSTHTPNLEAVANAAIDSGRFDVLMLAYHFGMWPHFGHILEKAHAHDVGVVAMKTLKGAKHENLAAFRHDRDSYAQSAFRWVLSNPNVSALVVSFWDPRQVDEYLAASGTELEPADVARLERYDRLVAGDYCQPHCGVCLDACPVSLPIDDVLRYRMYAKDYHWEREGKLRYAALERSAEVCLSCPAPCRGTCPQGIPIREAMLDADATLRLPA
jgi:predicted aldo/keto reductase-like oxidoreductase